MKKTKKAYKPPTVESLITTLGFCIGLMIGMFIIMLIMLKMAIGG